MRNTPYVTDDRDVILAAVYTINKAAKRQRDLHRGCLGLLRDEEVDGFPPVDVRDELERKGLNWSIELNGVTLAPFAYVPAFRSERRARPEKWLDAFDTAVDELEIMGMTYDEENAEYMEALEEQEALAEEAIATAKATIDGLHEILHAAKERKEHLYELKANAVARLRMPFVGFHHGMKRYELYALFAEGNYGFHMPVFFDEEAKRWEETGIEEVDEALRGLGGGMPDLLNDETIGMMSAKVNEEKSLGLSEDEAVAILEEFLTN